MGSGLSPLAPKLSVVPCVNHWLVEERHCRIIDAIAIVVAGGRHAAILAIDLAPAILPPSVRGGRQLAGDPYEGRARGISLFQIR